MSIFVREMPRQDFQGDGAVGLRVDAPVDDAHHAAQALLQTVRPQLVRLAVFGRFFQPQAFFGLGRLRR